VYPGARELQLHERRTLKIDYLQELRENELVRKRLAKLMALECFRNSKLEDFHAGTFPSSQADDYSDVKVVSPYGEIAWNNLSRLSDDEMKALMIDVVDRCDRFLASLIVSPKAIIEALKERDPISKWHDPK
jgi:hypothetical protein